MKRGPYILGHFFSGLTLWIIIQNAEIFYRSWKYWHSPVLHGKALAVVVAYDMYLECCKGKLNAEWKIEKPLDFWHFREKLTEQMLV